MNSYDFFIHEFICFMNSYMNSGVPRFQMQKSEPAQITKNAPGRAAGVGYGPGAAAVAHWAQRLCLLGVTVGPVSAQFGQIRVLSAVSLLTSLLLSFCIHAREHTYSEQDKQAQKRHSQTQQSIRRTLWQANQKMQEHARDILGIKDSCMT